MQIGHWSRKIWSVSSRAVVAVPLLSCLAGLGLTSCALVQPNAAGSPLDGTASAGSPSAGSVSAPVPDVFAPAPPPFGFDPERARKTLAEIPDNPPAPQAANSTAAPELPRQALRHLTEARRLFGEQRYSEALADAERALRYHSDIVEARRLAAMACLLLGKTQQAGLHADAAIALQPDDLPSRYVRGRVAEKAEEPDAALLEYRTALKCPAHGEAEPYLALTHYHLGMLLRESGYYRAAIEQLESFESALARAGAQPENPELAAMVRSKRTSPLLALAECHEALAQHGRAADAFAAALKHAPENNAARVRYIKNLVRATRFSAAESEALQHATTSKDVKSAELLLAVHRASGRQEAGLEALERLLDGLPENPDLLMLYADALISARKLDRATQVLNDLGERYPKLSAARWKLVSIHRVQGNRQAWIAAMGAQLAAQPADVTRALAELAQVSDEDAALSIDEALGHRAAAESQPEALSNATARAGYYYCLGWLANRLDRPEDAQTLYTRALQVKPEFVPASIGAAEVWIARCKWEKALQTLQEIRADDPSEQAAIHRLRGRCHDGLDNLDQALDEYKQAEKKHPTAETYMLMGRLLDRFQRFEEGAEAYRQAIRANPEDVEAREQLTINLLNRWSEGENLKLLLNEMKVMQEKAPEHPATTRTTSLVRLLMRHPPDLAGYVRVLQSLIEAAPDDHQSRRALAVGLIRQRKYDDAITELRVLLQKAPCDSEANELLCVALMRGLHIDEAAEQLAVSLERFPNREALIRNLAETRLVQQDYAAASLLWTKLLGLETNSGRHPLYRGRLISTLLQAGWHDRAAHMAEEWLADAEAKEIPAIRSYLLAADAAQGNHDRYLQRCREWLEQNAKDEQLKHWLLGIGALPGQNEGGLIGAGRTQQAIAQATAWASTSPTDAMAQYTLLQTLRSVRRYAEIIEISRANLSAADKPEQRLGPLQVLADTYLRAERYDEAIAAAKELANQAGQISESDLSFQLDELMVSYLAQSRRYDDAIVQANRIISGLDERDARLQQLAQNEGEELGRRVQIMQAQELIREQRSQMLRTLSFIYTKQDRRDQTLDCLQQALKLTPDDAGLNNDLGYTMADAGIDLDAAEGMLKVAVSEVLWNGVGEDDRQAAFLDSLGWLYYKRGKFDQARRWLGLAARMEDGDDAVIHDHLGDVEWRLGHSAEAIRSWQRAIELHDRKVTDTNAEPDEKLIVSLNAKIAEAQAQGKPAVATTVAD